MYYCCRLRAAVTIRTVEVNGRDPMFVKCAFECGAVIHRSGCVMSHTFTVAPLSVRVWGNRCATLEREILSLAGSVDGQYLCGEQDERYTQARIDTRPHSPAIKSLWEQPWPGTELNRRRQPFQGWLQALFYKDKLWMLTVGEGLQQSVVRLKGHSERISMAGSGLGGRQMPNP